jgi:hypothetical protein
MENQKLNLTDKNAVQLHENCIIFGSLVGQTEKHFFNIGLSPNDGSNEMFSCTYGYVHNVKQSDLLDFIYIGSVEQYSCCLECD